ncbi:MAG: hypothetical protein PHI28_15500, partial [Mangrovibacterium sp.]|nr:hypothetical protein [Mangrovibacterium sp.]
DHPGPEGQCDRDPEKRRDLRSAGKVRVYGSTCTAEQKQVTFGYENKDQVEITSGLKANDRLVIKGFETLRNRAKVKIIK